MPPRNLANACTQVLRTRLQTQQRQHNIGSSDGMRATQRYKGVLHTCRVMLAEEGWRAFYAGIGVNLVRAVPAAMTTMLTYEYLQRGIQELQADGEARLKPQDGYPV